MVQQALPGLIDRHKVERTTRTGHSSGIRNWEVRPKGHLVANALEALAYGSDTRDPPIAIEICLLAQDSREDIYLTNTSVLIVL